MTRTVLSSLAIAAVLTATAAPPAAGQNSKPKEIVVVGSKAKTQRPKALTGQQRSQKYYELKLKKALVVPVSPLPSKHKGTHKGEIEIYSVSPRTSPSAGSRKRRLQAR